MNAVPGRKAPMASGSAPDLMYCQPCAEDGKKILPDAFCPVCKEFLCSNCARVHRNMKIAKSHALQDKTSMPSSFRAESEDEKFSETCQHHSKEFIKYYCPRHDSLLCGDCVIEDEDHRSCKVEKIPQVAKRYQEGEEYISLKTGLGQMVRDIENYILYIQVRINSVDEESLTNINEFRKFRNKVNQYLDKRENELLAEIDQTKRTAKTLLNELKTKYTNIKSATEKLQSDLHAHEANSNQLLIVGKRAIKELEDLQIALEEVSMSKDVSRYTFDRDPATERLLASGTAIGRLKEGESTLTLGQQQKNRRTSNKNNENNRRQSSNNTNLHKLHHTKSTSRVV
ncbi:transcription intermediary factor 1-alpha-like [Mya arenaria]|uniref:transcription intermediary factor 1-alpha-like n=1 Tax=Mya arenaria TaxID=6604 RepID=UPI0022E7A035|nr:transcription intermediary factor 1-alpha-like [Mya arenaria]